MGYRILIAEDDALISEALKEHLVEMGHEVIDIVSDFESAKSQLELAPDFCFLDIRMHGQDVGFEIAEHIQNNYDIPFLFLTSFGDQQTVSKAAQYEPAAYLVKPFKAADIFTSLEIAMAKAKSRNQDKIEIKDGIKTYQVHPDDILFCKADNIYVEVYTAEKKMIERISLDKFRERLPDKFKKCHRSFVVNTDKISARSSTEISIEEYRIPVSRTFKKNL